MYRDRAWRRHQRRKALNRAARKYSDILFQWDHRKDARVWSYGLEHAEKLHGEMWPKVFLGRSSFARTLCSCSMCGNPRKWQKQITRAEKAAILSTHEQLGEWRSDGRDL